MKHVTISPGEAADRFALRELVEAYAHCADRRDAKGQMSLFTPDTHFVVYMNAKDPKPSQELSHRSHRSVSLTPRRSAGSARSLRTHGGVAEVGGRPPPLCRSHALGVIDRSLVSI